MTYTGVDAGAGPNAAYPNSNGSAANFGAQAGTFGTVTLINFESATLGTFTNLTVAPGVTISQTGGFSNISNTPNPGAPTLYGFNTTTGGSRFIDIEGSTVTFTFASPVSFFGGYFTGVQDFNADTLTFSDGTTQTVTLPVPANNAGGTEFVGFIDQGKSITSITISAGTDAIGLDDVRYGSATAAAVSPEPTSLNLLALGLSGVMAKAYGRRKQA